MNLLGEEPRKKPQPLPKGAGWERGAIVPTADFDFRALDPAAPDEETSSDQEALRCAFGLLISPARSDVTAARCALLFSLLNPNVRTGKILQLFPGVKPHLFTEARLELASLLAKKGADDGAT